MSVKDKIIESIFENPSRKYHLRELARKAKVNPNSVINSLKDLEREGIIRKETKEHIVEISADLENPKFIARKRVFNLSKFYDSNILEFLIKTYNPKSIILFGSYSRGEDIKTSDVDLAIITPSENVVSFETFEAKLNRKVHVMLVRYNNISDEFYTSLINGIVVYGYMDKK